MRNGSVTAATLDGTPPAVVEHANRACTGSTAPTSSSLAQGRRRRPGTPPAADSYPLPVPVALDAIRPDAPAIHVPGFIDGKVAAWMAEAVARVNFRPYSVTESSSAGAAYYFGANLYDTRPDVNGDPDYSPYFRRAARDRRALKRIMGERGLPDPLDDIFVPVLAANHDGRVGLAQEPHGSTYCAPVVRSTANGIHHHVDNGPLEAPELVIASVIKQRSMLLFLDAPGDGTGALQVFHKRPTGYDNSHHRHLAYGYTPAAVAGTAVTTIIPEAGDLVVFDSWNIHRVLASSPGSRRVTVSIFYGELPNGDVIVWT